MNNKTILIQGALDIETQYLINALNNKEYKNIVGYEFYKGTINNINIIISKTLVGTIHSTTATITGITTFHPDIIISQGIAGSHKPDIHIGDIIIGEKCCNINAYKMPIKNKENGSNPLEWEPNKRAKNIKYADPQLIDIIEKTLNSKNKIYKGTLGSGDVFNREYDRIIWLNQTFQTLCEDMESIGTYSVCNQFKIPCIGIRIISNNELQLEQINKKVALDLQKMLINILHKLEIKQ